MKLIKSRGFLGVCKSCLSHLKPCIAFQSSCSNLASPVSRYEGQILPLWAWAGDYGFDVNFGSKRLYKSAPLQERQMIDRRRIHVTGGAGGDGCTSFRKSRHARHGVADGGRGGKGGDVILKCSEEFWDFGYLQHHLTAKKGGTGSSKKRVGSRGEDKIVHVPVGTVIYLASGSLPSLPESLEAENMVLEESNTFFSKETGYRQAEQVTNIIASDESEGLSCEASDLECDSNGNKNSRVELDKFDGNISDSSGTEVEENGHTEDDELLHDNSLHSMQSFVAELLKPGQSLTVACGGEGGRGNASMARGRASKKTLPSREHESGHPGTEAILLLELKTIADVGLVGAPNAGKSTLLGAISRAKPKVGHYAFTTLRPNLGRLEFEDFLSITVADIPGLIKGAHQNVGLGHDFLRHIERTKVLAYVVDLAASLGGNKGSPPWDQFEELKFELEMYQSGLSSRPFLVVATKLDEEGAQDILQELRKRLPSMRILPVCAVLEQGIHELRIALRDLVYVEAYGE